MKKAVHVTSRGSMDVFYDIAEKLLASPKTLRDIFELPTIRQPRNKNEKAFIYLKNNKECYLKYKDYYPNVIRYAKAFNGSLNDIEKDSFVAFKLTNSITWPLAFWGLIAAGYKPLLINPILNKEDSEKLIKEANAKAIILENDEQYFVKSVNVKSLKLDDVGDYKPIWANEMAFCTSGTTGDSRIFVYDGEALSHQIYAAFCMPDTSVDVMYEGRVRLLAIVPFSHIFGFTAILLWYNFFGATIVFPKSNAPEDLVEASTRFKCSHIYAVPLFWDTVVNKFKHSLSLESKKKQKLVNKVIDYKNGFITKSEAGLARRKFVLKAIQKKILGDNVVMCIAGGSALSKETLITCNGIGYNLYDGYGMTEIGVTSLELSPKAGQRNKGSVGKPLTAVEYKIQDDELLVKSPFLHVARLANGERLKQDVDEEGYFHTGDIASIDEDGNYYIKGKKKDVVIGLNGENIYPDEIEIKFRKLHDVDNLSIIGIKQGKDEALTLILNVSPSMSKDGIKNLENEIKEINDTIPLAMQVREVYIAKNPIPLNASMKVKKFALVKEFEEQKQNFLKLSSGTIVSFEGYDEKEVKKIVDHLIDIFAEVLFIEKEKIAPNNHLVIDLGGDSFSYMSIIASVEDEFKVSIPSEMIGRLNSANEFALYILKNKN